MKLTSFALSFYLILLSWLANVNNFMVVAILLLVMSLFFFSWALFWWVVQPKP